MKIGRKVGKRLRKTCEFDWLKSEFGKNFWSLFFAVFVSSFLVEFVRDFQGIWK